jgi:hypothetical protein
MSISNLNKQPYPYIIKNRSNFFVELHALAWLMGSNKSYFNQYRFSNKTAGTCKWSPVNK